MLSNFIPHTTRQWLNQSALQFLPTIVKPVAAILPFKLQETVLLPALRSVFKEALKDGDFDFLTGKWLAINITDLGLNWLLSANDGQLIMQPVIDNEEADVSFSATGDDLLLIAGRKEDPDTLFFQRRLKIEGDTELGLEVKNLIDAIDLAQLPSIGHYWVEKGAEWIHQHKISKAQ